MTRSDVTESSTFRSFDGVEIAYHDIGQGRPVLLHHGFASNARNNWVACGVVDALVASGRRVVAIDARGHGRSGKPHEPSAYADGAMARDASALLDHLAIDRADVVGYSMGGFVASRLAPTDARVASVILGGVGAGLVLGRPATGSTAIADGLVADDPRSISDPTARAFRAFADSTHADRQALAACMRSEMFQGAPDLAGIRVPVLVLVGVGDTLVGDPRKLAAAIPGSRVETVEGDHLTAVDDPTFAPKIVAFLDEVAAAEGASVG